MALTFHLPDYNTMNAAGRYTDWVDLLISSGTRLAKRTKLGILFSFWWQIGRKEIAVFQNSEHLVSQVTTLIRDQVRTIMVASDQTYHPDV
jgi:hypothetical protein